MAKFRTNHQKNEMGSGTMVRFGLFAGLLGILFWGFNQFLGGESNESTDSEPVTTTTTPSAPEPTALDAIMLPSSTTGQIIEHDYYTLSYHEEFEQAEWVAYVLEKERLYPPYVERTGDFRPDPRVRKASASKRDYKGSGYDRGHLVPAGDMAFSKASMSQTFYMSNMSPQIHNFNAGIWRELEELVRNWAKKFDRLMVVTGPVLTRGIRERIGMNEVAVPDEFYKVILDFSEPEMKGIAFLIPNEVSYQPIQRYALSIDEVEEITGIDFFEKWISEEAEPVLEGRFDVDQWPFNKKKFDLRKNNWNKQ